MPAARKEPRWKTEQRERRRSKTYRWLRIIFLIFFFGSVVFLAIKLGGFVRGSRWDGKNQINVVIDTHPILLVSFDPAHKKINVLEIAPQTFIETIKGYGPYRIESIYRLGEMEGGKGGDLLLGSVQDFFGVPIDEWLEAPFTPNQESMSQYLKRLFFLAMTRGGKSSFNSWDLFRLWWRLTVVGGYQVETIGAKDTSASQKVTLPDGSEAIVIDTERFAQVAKKLFSEEIIGQEGLAIAVANGTSFPGLAYRVLKVVENFGGRVVDIGDWEEKVSSCQIRSARKEIKTRTVKRLTRAFSCQWVSEDKKDFRADIVVVIGEDYEKRLTGK